MLSTGSCYSKHSSVEFQKIRILWIYVVRRISAVCMLSLSHCLFSSYHFHVTDGFGWFSAVFVTAAQKLPSEPAAPGSLGVFGTKGKLRQSSQNHRKAEVGRHLWRLVQSLCSPREGHPIWFWVSPRVDSTASPGSPCQCSFTSDIIESIFM